MTDKKVLDDKDIKGGEYLREKDIYLSKKYGGYLAEKEGKPLKAYGKYVEPVLHSMEHTRRAIADKNPKEWARAKDELKSFGKGLNHRDDTYQKEYNNNNNNNNKK